MSIQVRRNTRQYFNNVALKGGFLEGEPLFITDEQRFAIATGPNSFQAVRKDTETTATSLVTPRNINGVAFNGTADIVTPTIYDTSFARIVNPGGGVYATGANVTGALFIKFPVGFTSTMIMITLKVFDYSVNGSYEVHCGGYTYSTNTWINQFGYIVGNNTASNNHTIRFGLAAGNIPIIYIGELATVRNYPQAFITEVQCGYSGLSSSYLSGWQVGVESTAFAGVQQTITTPKV